jgi:V8-like Glu-specific endopeptidase
VRDGTAQRGTWIGGTLLALAFAMGGSAVAAPGAADASSLVVKAPEKVRDYWTAARMRNAIPAVVPSISAPDAATGPDRLGPGADRIGPSRVVEPTRPTTAALSPANAKRGGLHKRVRHPRRYPNRTHGKVFFTSGAVDYVCSGTVVRAPSRSLVWTAGHCVYEPGILGGGFVRNFEFVPGYRKGHRPFGEWPARKLQSTSQWKNSGGLFSDDGTPFDEGAATVAARHGKHIQNVVGARGIAFNTKRNHTYRAYGYPAEAPPAEFDGRHLFSCTSPYGGADNAYGNPPPMRITCDMTGGSSGGGWVVKDRYIASVVSYGYEGDSTHLYGPYFGNAAEGLYNGVKNG